MKEIKVAKSGTKATRNYIILLLLAVLTVGLTLYICKWIRVYKEEKLSLSPLTDYVSEIYLTELKESISETNEAIIYFGYTNNEDIYNLEEEIAEEVESKKIKEFVFYVNVKDYLEENKYENIIKDYFPELKDRDLKAPLLIYTKHATPIKIKSSNKKMVTVKDFNNLANILETE